MNLYEGSPERIAAKALNAMNATDTGEIVIRWSTLNGEKLAALYRTFAGSDAPEVES